MNNIILIQAEQWLKELGIRTGFPDRGSVMVNRDDVANLMGADKGEVELMAALKAEVSSKLFWGSRDDDWFYLESF